MDDSRHLEPPGPGDASDLAGLAGRANDLWQWAGSPTEETLGSRLGTRHTGRGFVTEKLPTGTLARVLAGEAVGWVVIEPFIVACLRCGRRAEDQINMYLGIWRPVWTAAEQSADAAGAGAGAVFRGEPVTGQTPAVQPLPNGPPTGAIPAQPPSVAGPPPSATPGPPVVPPTLPVAVPPHPTGSQPSVGHTSASPAPPAGAAPTAAGPSTGSTPTTPVPPGALPPPSVPQLPPTPPAPPRSVPPPSLETDATQPIPRPAPLGLPGPPPPRQGPPLSAFPQGSHPMPPPEHNLGGPPSEPPVPSLPGTWSSSEPPPRRSSQRSPVLVAVALSMVAVVAVVVSVAVLRHKSDSGGHGTAASGDSRRLDPSDLAGDDDLLTASSQPSSTAQTSGSATPTPSASATPSPTVTGGSSSAPGAAGTPPAASTSGGGGSSSSPATSAAPPPVRTTAAPPPAKTTAPPPPPPTVCTPSGCAGKSYFVALGEHLWVCDQKPDGYAAVAEYTRTDVPNQNNVAWNRNGNGSCIDHNMNMPEGAKITFRVCLGDSNGKLSGCSGRITATA